MQECGDYIPPPPSPPPPLSICVITGRAECAGQLSFNWHGKIIGFECEIRCVNTARTGAVACVFFFSLSLSRVATFFFDITGTISKTVAAVVLNQRSCKRTRLSRVRFCSRPFFLLSRFARCPSADRDRDRGSRLTFVEA